jgi:thiol:disulfide interchange protein DsbD
MLSIAEGRDLFLQRIIFLLRNGMQLICRKSIAVAALTAAAMGPMAAAAAPIGLDIAPPVLSKSVYAVGDSVLIGLHIGIPAGFHLYGNPLGPGIGRPLSIRVEGAEPADWLDIQKIPAEKFTPAAGPWVWAYTKETTVFPRGVAQTVGTVRGSIIIDALICSSSCYPLHYVIPFTLRVDSVPAPQQSFAGDKKLQALYAAATETMAPGAAAPRQLEAPPGSPMAAIIFPAAAHTPAVPVWHYHPREGRSSFNLLAALLIAFIAGIILNAMPCVLPVLGIKILSLGRGSEGRAAAWSHGIAFASGVLAVFMLLAALAAFANYSWGKQFQDPRALTAIIAIIVLFALGLFDVYTLIVPAGIANLGQSRTGVGGYLFQGVFATLLATPCSGPFLGAVLAWSITQSPQVIFLVYGAIGLGMAFPYVLITTFRPLARIIPKPGRWMEDGKRIMGFLLLGFAAWLFAGLPAGRMPATILFCIAVAFAVMVYARIAPWDASRIRKFIALAAAAGIAVLGGRLAFVVFPPSMATTLPGATAAGTWDRFSADSLMRANEEGRSAIVDFTASWCLNCHYNFITALNTPEVNALIAQKNILALKADMTMPDPVQDSLLHALGSQSLPFLAVFPGNRPYEPIVLRDIVTRGAVMRLLRGVK